MRASLGRGIECTCYRDLGEGGSGESKIEQQTICRDRPLVIDFEPNENNRPEDTGRIINCGPIQLVLGCSQMQRREGIVAEQTADIQQLDAEKRNGKAKRKST